jgi:subtilisin family serine protease
MDDKQPESETVEILGGGSSAPGTLLSEIYDSNTGEYFAPSPTKDILAGVRPLRQMGITGQRASVAILDTGLLSHHPWIKNRLVESVDFTESDPEDHHGHGTHVALLLLLVSPGARIYNVKVINNTGTGKKEALIEGIRWATSKKVSVINISAGIHRLEWGLFECQGDCDVCRAAEEAGNAGINLACAAGNTPNLRYCPGNLGLKKGLSSRMLVVEAFDFDTLKRWPRSGQGNIAGPMGTYALVPVE